MINFRQSHQELRDNHWWIGFQIVNKIVKQIFEALRGVDNNAPVEHILPPPLLDPVNQLIP